MELKDLFITPILLIMLAPFLLSFGASRGDSFEKSLVYYGLSAKFLGALLIGLIYQFYYGGGDTFNFFHHSKIVWKATLENPLNFLKIAFSSGNPIPELWNYISKMYWYKDPSSFFVVKTASFFGLFTLNSYLPISLLFAAWSFSGSWAIYYVFTDRYPNLKMEAALAAFFIPSCIIWGSGLFKDTLTFGALGWLFFGFYKTFIKKEIGKASVIGGLVGLYILFIVKVYILISFVPCLLGWVVLHNLDSIKSNVVKVFFAPLFFAMAGVFGFFTLDQMAEENTKYDLDNLAITSQTTAYDIAFWSGKGAGSTYSLGELDGTFSSIISLAPQGIIVTLFRPWIWEVSNPLMLISAFESLFFLGLTLLVLLKSRLNFFSYVKNDPFLIFCISFSLIFAIGVGVSSFNFGSLARYKTPLLPFYIFSMLVINAYASYYQQKEKV